MAKSHSSKQKRQKAEWKIPPLEVYERQWFIEDFVAKELPLLLETAYLAIADAFVAAGVRLTPSVYRRILPKHALTLALSLCDENDRPSYKNYVFGSLLISKVDAKNLFAGVIKYVSHVAKNLPLEFREPTPRQHIEEFFKITEWSKLKLVREICGTADPDVVENTRQFLKRLCRPPKTLLQFAIDHRTVYRLKQLRAIMAQNAPQQFGSLSIDDLRWNPVTSER